MWKKNIQPWSCLDSLILLYYWVKILNTLKTPFEETMWFTGRHATPLVPLFFGFNTLLTGRHAMSVVIYWSTTNATDLRERFSLSGIFYFTLLPAGFKASLVAGASPSKLARLYADLWNIAPAQLFVWITTIHKIVWWSVLFKGYSWLANEESTFYGIRTLFTIGEHVRSLVLYPFGHRAMWFELN